MRSMMPGIPNEPAISTATPLSPLLDLCCHAVVLNLPNPLMLIFECRKSASMKGVYPEPQTASLGAAHRHVCWVVQQDLTAGEKERG